jgi:hypothetical protein
MIFKKISIGKRAFIDLCYIWWKNHNLSLHILNISQHKKYESLNSSV